MSRYADRLATDPLFLAEESLRLCNEEVINRTERIVELEAQIALLTAFVAADDRANALHPVGTPEPMSIERWNALCAAADARLALDWLPVPDGEQTP